MCEGDYGVLRVGLDPAAAQQKKMGDEEEEEGEDEKWDSSMSTEYLRALRGIFPLLQKGQQTNDNSWGSEPELEYLRDGESEAS